MKTSPAKKRKTPELCPSPENGASSQGDLVETKPELKLLASGGCSFIIQSPSNARIWKFQKKSKESASEYWLQLIASQIAKDHVPQVYEQLDLVQLQEKYQFPSCFYKSNDVRVFKDLVVSLPFEMEKVAGHPLSYFSSKKYWQRNPDKIHLVFKEFGKALKLLHNADLMHCDLSPSNVIFNYKTNTIKLLDFGLAHLTSDKKIHNDRGTPPYKEGTTYFTPKSDWYAYGMILLECLLKRDDKALESTKYLRNSESSSLSETNECKEKAKSTALWEKIITLPPRDALFVSNLVLVRENRIGDTHILKQAWFDSSWEAPLWKLVLKGGAPLEFIKANVYYLRVYENDLFKKGKALSYQALTDAIINKKLTSLLGYAVRGLTQLEKETVK